MRYRYRHVHQTIFTYVRDGLLDLGWGNAVVPDDPRNTQVNFGALPATYLSYQPEENSKSSVIADNTICVSLGDEDTDDLMELGGGLYSVQMPVFVDVYASNQALALSIASDAKDLMSRDMNIPLYDWTSDTPSLTAALIEFTDVMGPIRPASATLQATQFGRHWRVVKAIATTIYVPDA